MKTVTNQDVADFLGVLFSGSNKSIHRPADLAECGSGDLVWVKNYTPERIAQLEKGEPALVICDAETATQITLPCIVSPNPRLDFIKVLNGMFAPVVERSVHPKAHISPDACIGKNVAIGAFSCIGPEVIIGDDCIIGSGVSIEGRVTIGNRCRIKANSALGGQGFGFEYAADGTPIHFPHLGQIVLQDDVWIGACSTVEIASLGTTMICAGSKIDDLVQVGHNVTVGRNTLVMANVVICGGAVVGEHCWIAPNSVIKQKVTVGNKATVGLGSVVLKDVEDNSTIAGVPAKLLKPKD